MSARTLQAAPLAGDQAARRGPPVGLFLGLAFAALYALTWNGRYFHDGPIFLERLEAGELTWIHVLYLPLGDLVHRVLGFFRPVSHEGALALVSVASGAVAVAASFGVCERVTGDRRAAFAAAVLLGLAPVVWFGAGAVEIHVFSAAGAAVAAWIACLPAPGLAVRLPLAVAVALTTHLSTVFVAPFFLLLALLVETRRGGAPAVRRIVLALAVTAAVVLVVRWFTGRFPPAGTSTARVLEHLAERSRQTVSNPRALSAELGRETLAPWGALALTPFVLLLPGPRRGAPRAFELVACVLSLVLLWATAMHVVRPAGQLSLILAPLLAVVAACALTRFPRRGWIPVLAVAGHLAWAVPERARMAHDPGAVWAESALRAVERPCAVYCLDRGRMRRVDDGSDVVGVRFGGRRPLVEETRAHQAAGRAVYVDRAIVEGERGAQRTGLAKLRGAFSFLPAGDVLMRLDPKPPAGR